MPVYVPGPYTNPNPLFVRNNVESTIDVGNLLHKHGFDPEIPHLFHYWAQCWEHTYDEWMELCLNRLFKCVAVYAVLGRSKGVDIELAKAKEWEIPVFSNLHDLCEYRDEMWVPSEKFMETEEVK